MACSLTGSMIADGAGVAARLGIDVEDPLSRIKIYVPKRGLSSSTMFNQAFKSTLIYASGAFSIQQEIDIEYMITDISLVQDLLSFSQPQYSSLEIKLSLSVSISLKSWSP